MSTRILIGITVVIMLFIAYLAKDLAAVYISIVGGAAVYLLHAIEFKINKLLDYRGITVMDRDVARD